MHKLEETGVFPFESFVRLLPPLTPPLVVAPEKLWGVGAEAEVFIGRRSACTRGMSAAANELFKFMFRDLQRWTPESETFDLRSSFP